MPSKIIPSFNPGLVKSMNSARRKTFQFLTSPVQIWRAQLVLEMDERNFINEIEALKRPHVHIKDPAVVNRKIRGIISEGFPKLQVVSDFDLTITKQHENGKRYMSSFRMFGYCPSLTEEYAERCKNLVRKYQPIEYDPEIPDVEKRVHMEEWWALTEKALVGLSVSPAEINEMIEKLSPALRDRAPEMFDTLLKNNVPILVFSAGLGDTVVSVLKHYDVLFPNVKVISNFLKYNDDGTIAGFKGSIIHVMNKNEFAIKDSEYFDLIKDRDNVILLGDNVGDAKMADGMSHANHVLKIGFIYEKVEGNLPMYMDSFDIVLEDDQTMDVPRAIINLIN